MYRNEKNSDSTCCEITLTNVPTNYGRTEVEVAIQQHFNDDSAVLSIDFDKNKNVVATLKNFSYYEQLLKAAFIEVEYQDNLHRILITKPRSTGANQANEPKSNSASFPNHQNRLHPFEHELDEDRVEFIRLSANHMESLMSELEELALLDIPNNKKLIVRFKPNFKKLSAEHNQAKFEEDCMKIFKRFLTKFSTQCKTFDVKNLNRLRKELYWSESAELVQVYVDDNASNAVCVFVRSKFWLQGKVNVTGLSQDVSKVMKWLEKKCNVREEKVIFSPENFDILTKLKIIDGLCARFCNDDLHITPDVTCNSLLLQGFSDSIQRANQHLQASLQKVKVSQLDFLDEPKVDFLQLNIKTRKSVEQQFASRNVKAFFQLRPHPPMLKLVYSQPSDLKHARQILVDSIVTRKVETKQSFVQLTKNANWKRLEQDLFLKGQFFCIVESEEASALTLVGFSSSVDVAYRRIAEHIQSDVDEKKKKTLGHGFALFLHHFSYHVHAKTHLADVEWSVSLGHQCDISLKGKHSDVVKAEAWLDHQNASLQQKSVQIGEPGMSHYFQTAKGKEFLQTTETLSKCLVMVQSSPDLKRPPLFPKPSGLQATAINKVTSSTCKSSYKSLSKFRSSSTLSNSGVNAPHVITLRTGDIADAIADVIVTSCARGTFYSCSGSATSKALLAKAGIGLQIECHQQASDKAALQDFDIKITSGCNLKCKTVFHILLQKYNGLNEDALVSCIERCLLNADKKGFSKIAFPAIGTGRMGYPVNKLARRLKTLFLSFRGKFLRNIDIVLYPSDLNAIDAFLRVFGVPLSSLPVSIAASDLNAPAPPQQLTRPNLSVVVKQGDILTANNCDVMICSCAKDFALSQGKMSKNLLAKAGKVLVAQCQFGPVYKDTNDRFRVTKGGQLNCKRIVFVPSPQRTDEIGDLLYAILYWANDNKWKSIAFPAVFTGNIGVSSNLVAQEMAKIFDQFNGFTLEYLKHIEVIILDLKKLPVFKTALANIGGTKTSSNSAFGSANVLRKAVLTPRKATSNIDGTVIPVQDGISCSCPVTIILSSNDSKNIDQAESRIRKEVKEKSLAKTIQNDVIAKLTTDEEKEIIKLGKIHNVVVLKRNILGTELVISGVKDDVFKASDAVGEMLQEFKAALTIAEYVAVWKYQDQKSSLKMVDFPVRTSAKLEDLFKTLKNISTARNNVEQWSYFNHNRSPSPVMVATLTTSPVLFRVLHKNVNSVKLEFSPTAAADKKKCTIDFRTMTAYESNTYFTLRIDRVPKTAGSSEELPSHWTAMGNDQLKLVTSSSYSEEYKRIFNQFKIFGSFLNLRHTVQAVEIKRIQNPTLYKQFSAQKRKVETRMQQRGVQGPVTRELFHGTSGDVCGNICKDGFDRSHCGKHATAYGKGVYFATTASYSHQYTEPDYKGKRRMFLADVVTGECCLGHPTYHVPPLFPGSDSQRYDSVVNNELNPSKFVVFKDASVYPLYIVTYVYNL